MSVTDKLAIKGQINLWLWRIADENPRGPDVGEGADTGGGELGHRCAALEAGLPEMGEDDDTLKELLLGVMSNETHWLPVLFLSYSN